MSQRINRRLRIKFIAALLAIGASGAISWLSGPSHIDASAQIVERVLVPGVQKAELLVLPSQPPVYQIVVTGTVPGPGWGDADLIPTRMAPADGIWDFRFIVRRGAPNGPQAENLTAGFRVPGAPGMMPRGVRIQTARGVFTHMFERPTTDATPPGQATGVVPPQSCLQAQADWIGQRLVRAGDDPRLTGIREADLCKPYLVISPERPFTDRMYNPARLRIEIDGSGVIRAVAMG